MNGCRSGTLELCLVASSTRIAPFERNTERPGQLVPYRSSTIAHEHVLAAGALRYGKDGPTPPP